MASESKKLNEASECIRKAEKSLKTSFLKWQPDYDTAATEYNNAATAYKTIKHLEQSKECLLKAAECYEKNGSQYSAGKCYEKASLISRDLEDYHSVVDLIDRACALFREHGVPDTAAITLDKGAKIVESKLPEKAIPLYLKAADVVMLETRPNEAAEFISKAARLLVQLQRYDEAAAKLDQEMNYYLQANNQRAAGRLVVAQVLVHLIRDDFVAANKAFREGSIYLEMEELGTVTRLIEGVDQGDPQMVVSALNHPFIKHMDTQYAKLARTLNQRYSAQVQQGAPTIDTISDGVDNSAGKEEEDYSGLL